MCSTESRRIQKIRSCLQYYKDAKTIINAFGPKSVRHYINDRERMITNNDFPTLSIITDSFGIETTRAIVSVNLTELNMFYGNEATKEQIDSIVDCFIYDNKELKASELLLFFFMMKNGELKSGNRYSSRMYSNFCGGVIMECLDIYKEYRANVIDRHYKNTNNNDDSSERITYEEFISKQSKQ